MKIRCDRNELAQSLGDALGIVPAAQAPKPILMDFHLQTDGPNVIVEATDLDLTAKVKLERVEILEPGEVAVPAARLASLVREMQDRMVSIDALPEGRGAVLHAESCEFRLLGEDPKEFPSAQAFAHDDAVSVSREKFLEMLRRVAIAASRDTSRFQLTGVFFEIAGEKLTMTATDGKRLTNDHMRIENPRGAKASAIVPNRATDVMLKLLTQGEPMISLLIQDPNIHISFGRGELTAKVIEGNFPDYQVALNQKVVSHVTAKRADLLSATRTAALMVDRQTLTVAFSIQADRIRLSTQASDIGESKIEVPATLEGEPIELRFNPAYFIDALRCLTEDEVRLEISDAEKPAMVRGGQHYRHLVMPLVAK